MNMASLEREVVREAKNVFNNQKLTVKNIMEWSTGDIKKHDGEIIEKLPVLQINVAIKVADDKRITS